MTNIYARKYIALCVYIYTYISKKYMSVHINKLIQDHIWQTHINTYICTLLCSTVNTYIHTYVHMHICIYPMNICVCVYINEYAYVCIHIRVCACEN